jgi:hypothetical protein
MASQVKSQLSDKVYESTLDDLLETDQGLEVDLYKINIFNKDIAIAPGKVMHDSKKDIYYCYVYAIVDKRVAAKLGVYETRDNRGEIYDLSQFEEGSLLLFDSYIQDTSALIEFQMQEAPETSDNIFDYLKKYIKPVTNEQAAIKTQQSLFKKINMRMTEKFSDQTDLLRVVKLFKLQRPYDEEFLDSLKVESPDRWMFILIILELVFQVKFEFNVEGADELRKMVKEKPNTSTDVILVSLEEIPRHVEEFKPVASKAAASKKEEEDDESVVTTSKANENEAVAIKSSEVDEVPSKVTISKKEEREDESVVTSSKVTESSPIAPSKATPSLESEPNEEEEIVPIKASELSEAEEPFESTFLKPKSVLKPKTKKTSRLLEPIGELPSAPSEVTPSKVTSSKPSVTESIIPETSVSESAASEPSVSEATASDATPSKLRPKLTPRRSLKREETPKIKRNNAPPLVLSSKNNKP